MMPTS